MKDEIKKAKKVFKVCQNHNNCTRIAPIHQKPSRDELTFKTFDTITAQEYIDVMDEGFGSCKNPGTPYAHVVEWLKTGNLEFTCSYGTNLMTNVKLN